MAYLVSNTFELTFCREVIDVDETSTDNWRWDFPNDKPIEVDEVGQDFLRRFANDPAHFHCPRAPLNEDYAIRRSVGVGQEPDDHSSAVNCTVKGAVSVDRIHEISATPRGLALIVINNDPHYPVGCTDDVPHVDGDKLISLFTQMQYIIYGDRKHFTHTRQDLIQLIKAFAVDERQHEFVEDVLVCVIGRGVCQHGVVVCSDGKTVCRSEVEYFLSDGLCPGLEHRSRFILFVAGATLDVCGNERITLRIPDERICDSDQERLEHARNRRAFGGDFRALYAIIPVSNRVSSQEYGSAFIDSFVRTFAEHWHEQFTKPSQYFFAVLLEHMKLGHQACSQKWATGATIEELLGVDGWWHWSRSWKSPLSIFVEHSWQSVVPSGAAATAGDVKATSEADSPVSNSPLAATTASARSQRDTRGRTMQVLKNFLECWRNSEGAD